MQNMTPKILRGSKENNIKKNVQNKSIRYSQNNNNFFYNQSVINNSTTFNLKTIGKTVAPGNS